MWPMIWSIRGNGRRGCATSVSARSNTGSGSIWSISTLSRWATPQSRRNFSRPSQSPPRKKPARRNARWIAALVFVAILAAGAAYYFTAHRPKGVGIPEKSIAVLPMVNSTGDPANEYFSDGMSEEFISSLSRLHDLKVVGRTSSFQFKGKTDDSKTIGERLGVYYLLEGSVRKSADRVRIAVALIKSGDGANVWSETYDRELKDVFAVQSEIAASVAKELRVTLLGSNGQDLATAATPSKQNVEAYSALLQGNFYGNRSTTDDTRKAIGYYEDAIRLMRRAIAVDPLRVPFLYNLTYVLTALGRYDEAEATLRKGIELQPQAAQNYLRLAVIQILRGKPGVGLQFAQQETDPFWRTYA